MSDIDPLDFKTVLTAVVGQTVDDYVKLQHPTTRIKKYLQEHYLEAVDFLFDPTYELEYVDNDTHGQMTVKELLTEILNADEDYPAVQKIQEFAISETKEYWQDRKMAVLDHIPDTVCISGKTFNVQHSYITGYVVNVDELTIQLDKKNSALNQENFFQAVLEAVVLVADLPMKKTLLKLFSKELFWLLKVNNFFSYAGVASEADLFARKQSAAASELSL